MKTQTEKTFNTVRILLVASLTFGLSSTLWAMHHESNSHQHEMNMPHDTGKVTKMTQPAVAEVKRVQIRQGKVTLKHSYLQELDMPPMTMSFSTDNPVMIEGLKRGDKVEFRADSKMNLLDIQKIAN